MDQLPMEIMLNIMTQIMRMRIPSPPIIYPPGKQSKHNNTNNPNIQYINNNSNYYNYHPARKKLVDTYVQWSCMRLVNKRWYAVASSPGIYPKYERKKLIHLSKVAEEAHQYEGISFFHLLHGIH